MSDDVDSPELPRATTDEPDPPRQPDRSLTVIALVAELIALTSGSPVIVAITGLLAWFLRSLIELGKRR